MKEIVVLSNKFPKYNLFLHVNWRISKLQLLNLPVYNNKIIFNRMNRKQRFIDNLPKFIYSKNDNRLKEEEIARQIIY